MGAPDSTADRLFLRFRDGGDAGALGELFDRVAPDLRRIAARWAGDGADVEDLVQSTFLSAIAAAGRYDAERPVVPWLVGLLGIHARRLRRARARRPDPEFLEHREPDDPAARALDAELREAVDDAVEALPERYRAVVAGALLDGHPPRALARELERSPSTVRVQLHRGLALLRRSLPSSLATGLAVLLAPRRGLALEPAAHRASRRLVVEAARAVGGPTATALPVVGGVLMWKLVPPVVVALLLGAGLWFGAGSSPSADGRSASGAGALAASASAAPSRPVDPGADGDRGLVDPVSTGRTPAARRAAAAASPEDLPSARGLRVAGRVRGLAPEAIEEAVLWVRRAPNGTAGAEPLRRTLARVSTGREGDTVEFALELPTREEHPPAWVEVGLDHAAHRVEAVRRDVGEAEREVPFELVAEAVALARMRLVDEFGEPLAQHHAALLAFPEGAARPESELLIQEPSDAEGRVALAIPGGGRCAVLSAAWKRRPVTRVVELEPGRVVDLGDLALDRGETITGTAWLGDDVHPEGTLVTALLDGAEDRYRIWVGNQLLQLDWIDGRFEHIHCANLVEGDDGRFRILGACPRTYRIEVFTPGGDGWPVEVLPSVADLDLRDPRGRVRLVAPAGTRQKVECDVRVTPSEGEPWESRWAPHRGIECVIAGLPGSTAEVVVTGVDGQEYPFEVELPGSGEQVEREVPLPSGPAGALALVDPPGGSELEGLEFLWVARADDGFYRSGQGRFEGLPDGRVALRFDGFPAGRFEFELIPINAVRPPALFPRFEVEVAADGEEEVLIPIEAAAVVPIVVLGADGERVTATVRRAEDRERVTVDTLFGGVRRLRSDEGGVGVGTVELVLTPGRQRLLVSAKEHLEEELVLELEPGEVRERLEVRLSAE